MMTDSNMHEVKLYTAGPYDFKFDANNRHWGRTQDHNQVFLIASRNYWNDKLKDRGFVFLNEVLNDLGLPMTRAGQVVGWVNNDESDGFIDFDVDFTEADAGVIPLSFNVDGVIIDVLP